MSNDKKDSKDSGVLTHLFDREKESASPNPAINAPAFKTGLKVNLDQLQPYDRNPRQSVNPKYDSIKTSIKNSGLDHPPNITARPGADHYMIRDGGNTRLKILRELWEETHDIQFFEFGCTYYPWESDLHAIAKHMAENEERGDTPFIDKALAAKDLEAEILLADNIDSISIRQLADRITREGWTVNHSNLGVMFYAVNELHTYLSTALWNGIGRDSVKKIKKLEKSAREYWNGIAEDSNASFDDAWHSSLTECDSEDFSISDLQSELCSHIKDALNIQGTAGIVDAEIDAIINGYNRQRIIPDATPIPITAPKRTQPPSEPDSGASTAANTTVTTSTQTAETARTEIPVIPTGLNESKENPQHLKEGIQDLLIKIVEIGDMEKFIEFANRSVGFSVHLSLFPRIDTGRLPHYSFMQETILAVLAQIRSTALDDPNHLINEDICKYLFNGHWQQMSYQLYLGNLVAETDENFGDAQLWASIASVKKYVRTWNQSIKSGGLETI